MPTFVTPHFAQCLVLLLAAFCPLLSPVHAGESAAGPEDAHVLTEPETPESDPDPDGVELPPDPTDIGKIGAPGGRLGQAPYNTYRVSSTSMEERKARAWRAEQGIGQATQEAKIRALRWLCLVQKADGHWDADLPGAGDGENLLTTALALHALLGDRRFDSNAERAVQWLLKHQRANGSFSDTIPGAGMGSTHLFTGLALAEAARIRQSWNRARAAERALDFAAARIQALGSPACAEWGWRPDDPACREIQLWYLILFQKVRAIPDFAPSPTARAVAGSALQRLIFQEQPSKGEDAPNAYVCSLVEALGDESFEAREEAGTRLRVLGAAARPELRGAALHGSAEVRVRARELLGCELYGSDSGEERRTNARYLGSLGSLCLLGTGVDPAAADWTLPQPAPPAWRHANGDPDPLHLYLDSQCELRHGTQQWQRWWKFVNADLIDWQRIGGGLDGSWDPAGPHAATLGRAGFTALVALCIPAYRTRPQPAR